MTNKDEALKMAIECLELYNNHIYRTGNANDVINACKEALEQPAQGYVLICKRCGDDLGIEYVPDEQPAQEPVAWLSIDSKANEIIKTHQWQGLTDDEIDKVYYKTFDTWSSEVDIEFARAIEAKLKEKNTVTER
jgi:hypothetical protein